MSGAEEMERQVPWSLWRDAFDRRFTAHLPRLLALCMSLVGGHDAEDIVQEVYVVGRRNVGQLRDSAALEAWLSRIAVNLCYERRRRGARVRVGTIRDAARDTVTGRDAALLELVASLPPRERTILVLHYGHGYRLEEIATLLSLSHTNVRSIIARTRKRLYRQWTEVE